MTVLESKLLTPEQMRQDKSERASLSHARCGHDLHHRTLSPQVCYRSRHSLPGVSFSISLVASSRLALVATFLIRGQFFLVDCAETNGNLESAMARCKSAIRDFRSWEPSRGEG